MADGDYYDPDDARAIAALTREQLIDNLVENEMELRRDRDYDMTRDEVIRGILGTNFLTTRQLRDEEYGALMIPEELRLYQPDDGPVSSGGALTVTGLVMALSKLVSERPELAHEVPLMWHVLDNDVSIGARVVKVDTQSFGRVRLIGPKEEPVSEPKKEEINLRCRQHNIAPALGGGYVTRQCTKTVGHGARHSFKDEVYFDSIDAARMWKPL